MDERNFIRMRNVKNRSYSLQMTVKDEGGCSSSARSAMYIALDPTQDIVAELHAIVDS